MQQISYLLKGCYFHLETAIFVAQLSQNSSLFFR